VGVELDGLTADRLLALDRAVPDVPTVTAMRVRSTRDLMPSLWKTWRRCVFTVCGETNSLLAMARLV
jgi:hypothetical protein